MTFILKRFKFVNTDEDVQLCVDPAAPAPGSGSRPADHSRVPQGQSQAGDPKNNRNQISSLRKLLKFWTVIKNHMYMYTAETRSLKQTASEKLFDKNKNCN